MNRQVVYNGDGRTWKVWRYITLKSHNFLNVAQKRNVQGNDTCNVTRNQNVLPVAKLIRCRKWQRFNAKNLIVSTNNCSALKNCSVPKMRNVLKRWNAPILCNVLRSCSVAQNCIVSNMAISSGCRNNGTVCDVYLWFTCTYVNGGRFLSERCMFWERCLFWERCMFLERCRFCERCNYNLSVQIFFTFEPVVPPYKRQVFVVLACHQSACVNAQMSEWMIELSKAAERTKKSK